MNVLLILLISLAVVAVIAVVRELPMDGFRQQPRDRERWAQLRERVAEVDEALQRSRASSGFETLSAQTRRRTVAKSSSTKRERIVARVRPRTH